MARGDGLGEVEVAVEGSSEFFRAVREGNDDLVRRMLATIPADLELAIVRCLAKDPAERHKSAEDLSTALLSVAAAKEWDAALAKLWWQTHQSPAGHPGQRRASPG